MESKISYDSNECLGEGSYGTEVFRGFFTEKDDKKPVAVKVIPSVKKEKYVDEFQRLVQFSTNTSHDNVVKYYHVDATSGPDLLIAIELCEITLEDFVEYNLGEETCMGVIRQLLNGLGFLHSNNITHGDLTPSNALLQKQDEEHYVLKLADFCMSRIITSRWMAVAKSSSGIGTTEWMAPEILRVVQALDKNRKTRNPQVETTFSSDVFAVGCLIFYIVSNGQHPYGEMLRRESNVLDNKKYLQFRKIGTFYWPVLFALCKMLDPSPQLRPSAFDIIAMSQFFSSTDDYLLYDKISTLISDSLILESSSETLMTQMNAFIKFINESWKNSQNAPVEFVSLSTVKNLIQQFLTSGKSGSKLEKLETHHQIWLKDHFLSWKIMLVDSFWSSLDKPLVKSKNDVHRFMIFLMDQVQDAEAAVPDVTEVLSTTHISESKPKTNVSIDHLINAAKVGSYVEYINVWREYGRILSENEILKILQVTVQNSAPTRVPDRIRILEFHKSENSKIFQIKSANLLHLSNIPIEILIYLINQDANLFAQNTNGQTLLHLCPTYLSSAQYCQLVNVICRRNRDFVFRIPCSSGIYPLHVAVKMFELSEEIMELLYSRHHLSSNCTDNDGRNIFDIALCSQRSEDFLLLLRKYRILPSTEATREQKELPLKRKMTSIEEIHGKKRSSDYIGSGSSSSLFDQKTQTMTPLLVGDADCTFQEVAFIFEEYPVREIIVTGWTQLALHLDIPIDLKHKLQRDLILDKHTHIDVMFELLMNWRMRNGTNATLGALYEAIPIDMKPVKDLLQDKIREKAKCWSDLDADSQKVVMRTSVNLLGKKYSLLSIQNMMSEEKFDEIINKPEMKELFFKSFENEDWNLGNYDFPKPVTYYINRNLTLKRRLNPAIFKHHCTDIFVIEGIQHHHLSILAGPHLTDTSSEQLIKITRRFILLEHPDHYSEILKIAKCSVHRIKHKNDQFLWISTSGSCQIIRVFLTNEIEEISESTFVADNLSTFNNRPIAICSSPAMGKSVLLANLANQLRKTYPNRITIFLELRSLIRELSSHGSEIRLENVRQIIISCPSICLIGQEILFEFLKNTELIFEIFLDGFDEISSEYLPLAKQFIKCLINCKNIRTFITSRPHMRNEIENTLEVISLDIAPFSHTDQVNFLCDYWTLHQKVENLEKLSQFATSVLKSLELLNRNVTSFAGIPLQCYMLAQIYANQSKNYCNRDHFNFQPTNSFYELYSKFIEFRFQNIKENDRHLIKIHHWKEALLVLFPDDEDATKIIQQLTSKLQTDEAPMEKIYSVGILEYAYGKFIFVHRTFAEYLLAEFIVEGLLINENVDINLSVKFIIDSVLFVHETAKGHKLSDYDVKRIRDVFESTDLWSKGKINLKELQAVLLSQCDEPIEAVGNNVYTNLFSALAQNTAKTSTDVLDCALGFLDGSQLVDEIHLNVLQENRVLQHEMVCIFLDAALENHDAALAVKESKHYSIGLSQDWNQIKWKLLLCTEQGYHYLTKTLIKLYRESSVFYDGINSDTAMCEELLIRALYNDNVQFLQYICHTVEPFLQFDLKEFFKSFEYEYKIFKRTPLFKSISRGNYRITEYLLYYIGEYVMEAKDLWLACFFNNWKDSPNVISNKLKILQLLTSLNQNFQIDILKTAFPRGVNVALLTTMYDLCDYVPTENDANYMGSSINFCCGADNEMDTLVDWLLSRNFTHLLTNLFQSKCCLFDHALIRNVLRPETLSNVYRKCHFDLGTILKSAVLCKRSEAIAKTIVELSGDVNLVDHRKKTLLHYAAFYQKLPVLNYLLCIGADVNLRNAYGNTPLHDTFQNMDPTANYQLIHDMVNLIVTHNADVGAINIARLSALDLAKAHQETMSIEEKTLVLLEMATPSKIFIEASSTLKSLADDFKTFSFEACRNAYFCGCFFAWAWNIVHTSGNVNLLDSNNSAMLHFAATFGERKTMEYLLQKGADANPRNNDGDTPLHYIFNWNIRCQDEALTSLNTNTQWIHKCTQLLLKYNADVSVQNNKGETPLGWAQQQKDSLNIEDRTISLLVKNLPLKNEID